MTLEDFFGLMFDEMVSLLMEEAKMSKVRASMFATELIDRIEDKYSPHFWGENFCINCLLTKPS